jgi:hypothetical protein
MPLQGEVYVVENNPSTYIIRLERREGSNDHPGVGFRETKLENLIARMESEGGHRDALQGIWNSDALFGFAVRAILDHQARPSRLGEDRVWRRLLEMGLEGGEMPGRAEGDLGLMQAIRYAAVIASELMRRQEGLEDWVRPGDRGRSGLS